MINKWFLMAVLALAAGAGFGQIDPTDQDSSDPQVDDGGLIIGGGDSDDGGDADYDGDGVLDAIDDDDDGDGIPDVEDPGPEDSDPGYGDSDEDGIDDSLDPDDDGDGIEDRTDSDDDDDGIPDVVDPDSESSPDVVYATGSDRNPPAGSGSDSSVGTSSVAPEYLDRLATGVRAHVQEIQAQE